jgi:hypothetical protein
MFEGVKFEVSRLYLSSFCLLPSALCLPPAKITKSCQEPHYPLSDTSRQGYSFKNGKLLVTVTSPTYDRSKCMLARE